MEDDDLWGTFDFGGTGFDPKRELERQAVALGRKTDNLITAEIKSRTSKKWTLHEPKPKGSMASAHIPAGMVEMLNKYSLANPGPLDAISGANELLGNFGSIAVQRHSFELSVPELGYNLRLFQVEHLAVAPPVRLKSEALNIFAIANSEKEFKAVVGSIIGGDATTLAIKTLWDKILEKRRGISEDHQDAPS